MPEPCPKCGSTTNWHVGHGFDIADLWPEAAKSLIQPPSLDTASALDGVSEARDAAGRAESSES